MMRLRYLLLAAGILIAALFVARGASAGAARIDSLSSSELGLMALALGLGVGAVAGLGLAWIALLRFLKVPGLGAAAFRLFAYTWLARYIPGTIPYHASRLMLAETVGASRGRVAASIAYETVLALSSAAAMGAIGVLLALGTDVDSSWTYLLAIVPLAALPVLLHPRLLVPAANRLLALARRAALTQEALLTHRQTSYVFVAYAVVHCLNGLAFYFVLQAVTDSASVSLPLAVGVYGLSSAAGVAVPLVPSGLGVREAVIVGILGVSMPAETALVVAGAARAVSVAADVAFVSLFAVIHAGVVAAGRLSRKDVPAPDGRGREIAA